MIFGMHIHDTKLQKRIGDPSVMMKGHTCDTCRTMNKVKYTREGIKN